MDQEITANLSTLFKQSDIAAKEWFDDSEAYLRKYHPEGASVENALRLAELMANDYRTMMISLKIQEVSQSMDRLSESLREM